MLAVIFAFLPILEIQGGLFEDVLVKMETVIAIPIVIIGNINPITIMLLFIRQIFQLIKKTKVFYGMIDNLEKRAMGKSDKIKKYEFWGLLLFVGIPLPGTGAWTGALIASLLEIDIKKSSLAIFGGIFMASVIMYVFSYLLVGSVIG